MPKRKHSKSESVTQSGVEIDAIIFESATALHDAIVACAPRTEISGTEERTSLLLAPRDAARFGIGEHVRFSLQRDHAKVMWYPPGEDLVSLSRRQSMLYEPPADIRDSHMAWVREKYARDKTKAVLQLLAAAIAYTRDLP